MNLRLAKIGKHPTVDFAVNELRHYLSRIDPTLILDVQWYEEYLSSVENVIWVGPSPAFSSELPAVPDDGEDTALLIRVENDAGVITGNNPCAVLIAAYRFLKELGCEWIRPGKTGEILPAYTLRAIRVHVRESASYRYRGTSFCGASYQQEMAEMIDWLPKQGMNHFFVEGFQPYDRFGSFPAYETAGEAEKKAMIAAVFQEAQKRSLKRHAVGHGWQFFPVGMDVRQGYQTMPDEEIPDGMRERLAMLGGRRKLYGNRLVTSNLCYSQKAVRDSMVDSAVDYLKAHRDFDYLHFWVGDGCNNTCECEDCTKLRLADFYVKMLDDLDKKLTAEKINVKIVFLIYNDLLWEPVAGGRINPARYICMFAPVRTYNTSFFGKPMDGVKRQAFVLNRSDYHRSPQELRLYLDAWRPTFDGDGFLFDYHLYVNQFRDAGGIAQAKILFEDTRDLFRMGLNGAVACAIFKSYAPTAFSYYAMGRALWDKEADFETVKTEYFQKAFGSGYEAALRYSEKISDAFGIVCRYEAEEPDQSGKDTIHDRVVRAAEELIPFCRRALRTRETTENQKLSWRILHGFSRPTEAFAKALLYRYQNLPARAGRELKRACRLADRYAETFGPYLGAGFYKMMMGYILDSITEHGQDVKYY